MLPIVLLVTVCPGKSDIQLALYYLKAYFLRYSKQPVNIQIRAFSYDENLSSVVDQIFTLKPVIIGFSCYVWNITKIFQVIRAIRENMPKAKIVLGGPEVSPCAHRLMQYHKSIDAVVVGEGEQTFKELVEHWLEGSSTLSLSKVSGLVFRARNKVMVTGKRVQIPRLDEIPSPYLEGIVDINWMSYRGEVPLETMRGCFYQCHYCYYYKGFHGIRYFALERIGKELQWILKNKPRRIDLMDPTFNQDTERAKQILKFFINYNQNTKLHVEVKAELLDKEMVELLSKAKANFVEIGIQTTNKKTLRIINRDFSPTIFGKNILLLNRKKIFYEIQLIDSLPGDNYNSLKQSLDWLFRLHPASIKIMRLMLLPGSYLRQHAQDLKIRYNHRAPYFSLQSNTFSRQDLKKTQNLRLAINILYNKGLLRNTLRILSKIRGLSFSRVLEEWFVWMQVAHKGVVSSPENRLRDNILTKVITITKIADLSDDFIDYLYRKYNRLLDSAQIMLIRSVRQDRKRFLKKYSIERIKLIN